MPDEPITPQAEGAEDNPDVLRLTPDELQSKLDAEADKRVQKVLEKKQAEWDAKLKEVAEKAKNEGAQYAQMTAAEKAQAEFEAKQAEFEKREQDLARRELSAAVSSDLAEKGLPSELAENLVKIGDATAIKEWTNNIAGIIETRVNEQVKQLANGGKPAGQPSSLADGEIDPILAIANAYK
ncbi:head scaffolding protein [Weissella phage WCP30]|uniref:head scaffolding protein n=1 Tax=Weissella phage WCP30 TaxID=1837862 RepID=UPI00081118E5|nr:head scaffolding protein [Weissella phage WCP30]ANU78879.1 scaffold protein [Weissella phage WCP30]